MGDDLTERVEALERKAKLLRRWVLVLAAALVGVGIAGASGPQELRLRKLTIEDGSGHSRIVAAATTHEAPTMLTFIDPDGKPRVMMGTLPNGGAGWSIFDDKDKVRVFASTSLEREALLSISDSDIPRIVVHTMANGLAELQLLDRDGRRRIASGTFAEGSAASVLVDSKGEATWQEGNK